MDRRLHPDAGAPGGRGIAAAPGRGVRGWICRRTNPARARVTTGSIWPVAGAHAAVNVAWEISTEVSQTKSTLVLEYIGGESGVLMICGLLAADAVLIRNLRNTERDARA